MVVFEEIPNEIVLAINITGCPCHCKGCHSKFLWEDNGTPLSKDEVDMLIRKDDGITCICFMGGDSDPSYINELAGHIRKNHQSIKVGWYSGREDISSVIDTSRFDYIKIGPYIEECGPLNKKTTNQRLYRVNNGELEDITSMFWPD